MSNYVIMTRELYEQHSHRRDEDMCSEDCAKKEFSLTSEDLNLIVGYRREGKVANNKTMYYENDLIAKCIDLYGQEFFDNTLAGKAKIALKHATRAKKPKREKQIKGGDDEDGVAIIGPSKKKRTPSEYNLFMKEVIARIKGENPEMPHIEAFTLAAKLWKEKSTKEKEAKVAEETIDGESKNEESENEAKNEVSSESKNEESKDEDAARVSTA